MAAHINNIATSANGSLDSRFRGNDKVVMMSLCLVFLIPLLAASLLYVYRDTYPLALHHHGKLLSPKKPIHDLGKKTTYSHKKGKWEILYFGKRPAPPQLLKNLHRALGKEQEKVMLNTFVSNKPPAPFKIGSLAIVDPEGFLLMHYEPNTLQSVHAKGILEDMRKLLRCSHG